MQVEAVYDNGKLHFTQQIKLKKHKVKVVVLVPDEDVIVEKPIRKSAIGQKLDNILGELRGSHETDPPGNYKDIWHKHLEEKYIK